MGYEVTPNDSRYIPFTQQKLCCVPTSISMIMYRNNIPLIPIEELGYHLGLVLSPEDGKLFFNPRISETPPEVGYGTQIQYDEYDPNKVFVRLNIPLSFQRIAPGEISNGSDLIKKLNDIVDNNKDAVLCFDYNTLHGIKSDRNCGHIVVFDRVIDGKVRIIDPECNRPKWQTYDADIMLEAMKRHERFSGGVWLFTKSQ